MPAVHGSHSKSIPLDVSPAAVFECFSNLELRHRWFRIPGPANASEHELDFRVGGLEVTKGTFTAMDRTEALETRTHFIEIVPPERIVSVYELWVDRLRSVSVLTIEFTPTATGTRLDFFEQYTFIDPTTPDASIEIREREGSTRLMLNGLKATAERVTP